MGVREDLIELQEMASRTAPALKANAQDALNKRDTGRFKGAVDGITTLWANARALEAQISAAQPAPPRATLDAARGHVQRIAKIKDQVLGLDRGTRPSTRETSPASTPPAGSPSTTTETTPSAPLSTGKKLALGGLVVGLVGGAVAVARKLWGK